jgi:hypothetical protein
VVLILDPQQAFLDEEVDALRAYLEGGGAVLVAREPTGARTSRSLLERGEDPLDEMVRDLFGVEMGEGVLASEENIVAMRHNKVDRVNIVTDRFSSHPSTSVLSESAPMLFLFTPTSGWLEEVGGEKGTDRRDHLVTVRSQPESWADKDGDLEFDAKGGEKKRSRPIVAVSSGGGGPGSRAMITADATLFSDLALGNRGNQQFVYDGLNWLVGTMELTGTVGSEEDVKIRHTKEGQAGWFYGTVLGVPLLLLGAGFARVYRRRKGDES